MVLMFPLYIYSLSTHNTPDTLLGTGAEMVNKSENSNFQEVYILVEVGGRGQRKNKWIKHIAYLITLSPIGQQKVEKRREKSAITKR